MSVAEFVKKSNIQAVIAVVTVTFCLYALIFINLKSEIIIALSSFLGIIYNYYYGSSRGSQLKDLK